MDGIRSYLRQVGAIAMDDVAPPLRPAVRAYSAVDGASIAGSLWLVSRMASFEAEGPGLDVSPCIHALWHEGVFLYMLWMRASGRRAAALMHPTPFLRPYEASALITGWHGVRGSTGRGGRAGADLLCEQLDKGWSVMSLPDGPYGPPKTLRKGTLHMAMQSGRPVVPLSFEVDGEFRIPSWDRKRFFLPGGRVKVHCHAPIFVKEGAMDEASERLRRALG